MWPALAWGAVSSIGLVLGAVVGASSTVRHRAIAQAMSLGAGLLLATAVLQLAAEAVRAAGPALAAASLLLGAGTFSAVNARLEGAARRKRCGECVAQPSEAEAPGSGAAIALGTALDAVPEALVLGLALREGAVPVALILAIAVGNLPEALSGAAGMRAAGRSYGYVFAVWGGIAAGATVATAAAYLASARLGAAWPPPLQAFAAGALWAMTAETMIPEAFHDSPRYSGLLAAVGFALLLLIEAATG